eukprot:scaffold18736_cov124-Isochrysis_galbana.AAC.3
MAVSNMVPRRPICARKISRTTACMLSVRREEERVECRRDHHDEVADLRTWRSLYVLATREEQVPGRMPLTGLECELHKYTYDRSDEDTQSATASVRPRDKATRPTAIRMSSVVENGCSLSCPPNTPVCPRTTGWVTVSEVAPAATASWTGCCSSVVVSRQPFA